MANPTVTHRVVTGAAADPRALVDGPAWDDTHVVSGLENVDNTSDATKNAAVATLTNKDLTSSSNTFPAITATQTHAATSKATPVDADELPLVDSAASFGLGKLTWANLKATVKAYFDTLYQPVDADLTAIAGLSTAENLVPYFIATGVASTALLDTDGTLLADSDTRIASQKATKTYVDAQVSSVSVATATHAATSKATPVDADELPLVDSAASFGLGKLTWANLKATVKSYFDTLYQPLDSDLTTLAGLTATTDNFIVSVASTWASRTPAQAKTTLALVKGDVGLGNVDNTSDATKNSAAVALTNKTYNGLTVTSTTGSFTLTNGKTLSVGNTLTFSGTDGSTLNIGAGGTLASAAYVATGTSGGTVPLNNTANNFSAAQTISAAASPLIVTNSNNTAGDIGVRIHCGATAVNDTATIYLYFRDSSATQVYGSVTRANGSAVAYNTTSDRNLKTNIVDPVPADGGLKAVMKMRPRIYSWRGDTKQKKYLGLIAQELYETKPDAVTPGWAAGAHGKDDPGHPWAINYQALVPELLLAVQELANRVAALDRRGPP